MSEKATDDDFSAEYREREAVAVFDDEASLNAAVDALMQFGLRETDMSVLGDSARLAESRTVRDLEDDDDAPRAPADTSDSRTEGLAALVGGPALIAGFGAALVAGSGGAALIPAIAVTAGSGGVAGALGLILARAFGRKHASYVQRQIEDGGLLLWVSVPDEAKDTKIVDILAKAGGRDIHFHVAHRKWGAADVPFHDAEPDPLLRN